MAKILYKLFLNIYLKFDWYVVQNKRKKYLIIRIYIIN